MKPSSKRKKPTIIQVVFCHPQIRLFNSLFKIFVFSTTRKKKITRSSFEYPDLRKENKTTQENMTTDSAA